MRKPMKCKLCGHIDESGEINNSVYSNDFGNKPLSIFYPIVKSWNDRYVFLCRDCYKKLTGDT